jgi:hypothetical protein
MFGARSHAVVDGTRSSSSAFKFQSGRLCGKGDPMISVIVPMAVWRELAGKADRQSWVGRTIDVQATPHRIRSKFINLEIRAADQVQSDSP